MRAAVVRDTEVAIEVRDLPHPGPHEVLLRIDRAGICGSDLHALELAPAGAILGHEFCGTVAAVGPDVTTLRIGDQATSLPAIGCRACLQCLSGDPVHCPDVRLIGGFQDHGGAFAEYLVVGEREALRLPDALDPRLGALVEPLAVGLKTIERANLRSGDRLVVLGAGPVGLAVVLWARHLAVADIVVTDPIASRRQLALTMGATAAIDPSASDLEAWFSHEFGGRPEVVIECAGRPGTLDAAVRLVAREGRVVIAGMHFGTEAFTRMDPFLKDITVEFSSWYRVEHFQRTIALMTDGRIDPLPLVTHEIALEQLPTTMKALQAPNDFGKVLVRPSAAQ